MKLSEKAQKSLDRVIEKFKAGDLSAIIEAAVIELPEDAPALKWSYSNRVLALAQTNCPDCRGFRQWQHVGRQVKKGSTAAFIITPYMVKDEKTDERKLAGFCAAAVFPYTATAGDENGFHYEPQDLPPLADVAQRLGIPIRYQPTADLGAKGWTDSNGTAITLGTDDAKTYFHELAHAIHAHINGGPLEPGQDEQQETIAEFTATVLMHLYGLGDRTGNAWQYIAHYADDPLTAITRALSTVEKILAVIEETS